MDKKVVIEKTNQLLAGHCAEELRTAAVEWLDAVDTEKEAAASEKYVKEMEQAVMTVDELLGFLGTDIAKNLFGEEQAAAMTEHTKELKANGGKYCDCPACTLAVEIHGMMTE